MRGFRKIKAVGSLTSTASSTATIFAAGGSGTKWCLTKGLVTYVTPAANATLTFQETYVDGTAGSVLFRLPFATNAVAAVNIDFGEDGIEASATNTRLVWLVEGANATANIVFAGYYR